MEHIVISVCFSATKLLPERQNLCIFPILIGVMFRLSLNSMWIQLVAFIVNLWKKFQDFWMKWQVRWYRSKFKLFKQVNKSWKTTEFYCQSLTFLKLLGKWALLWGVTEMIPNIIQNWPVTHAGVGNFVELLNFAVCQGNKDLEDHLKNCSSRDFLYLQSNSEQSSELLWSYERNHDNQS